MPRIGLNLICGSVASSPIPDSRCLSFLLKLFSFRSVQCITVKLQWRSCQTTVRPWLPGRPLPSPPPPWHHHTLAPFYSTFYLGAGLLFHHQASTFVSLFISLLLQDSLIGSAILKIMTEAFLPRHLVEVEVVVLDTDEMMTPIIITITI